MEEKRNLTGREKIAFGIGAVGKDMVYMLSASYVLYYYQDLLGVNAVAMGIILMAARIFDAFNDPIMGVIVAKTKTKWGKFRPWLLIGTLTDAVVLYLMFAAPPTLSSGGLVAYAAVTYILWGVTYTIMDIPFWSMIPAFTTSGKEREGLSALGRSCAGVGSALITVITVMSVASLGNFFAESSASAKEIERVGFKYFALAVAVLFIVFIVITCITLKEKSTVKMESASVKDMFAALIRNDQAMTTVITIVLVNSAVYITSNLLIYFFKYDLGGESWRGDYTLFSTFGGACQILSMMILFPLLRKKFSTLGIFYISAASAMLGYLILLGLSLLGVTGVYLFFIPALFVFSAVGMLSVVTTIFLANSVDYGEVKNFRRDESVIFSMQTFVVKLASGISAFIASLCLSIFAISSDEDAVANIAHSSVVGLRMAMTIIPICLLVVAVIIFKRKFVLDDKKLDEITTELEERKKA